MEVMSMQTKDAKTGPLQNIEPATTFFDNGKFLRILTDMPGISEERIKINLEKHSSSVTIIASDTGIQYKKVITIPFEVRVSKKRFSDGVLDLTLEKTNPDTL